MSSKPYAPACERNREPIYAVISQLFADKSSILEIGSGTGQHAVYFAERMPHLHWQCSDLEENQGGIRQWLDEARLPNTPPPVVLDVLQDDWPVLQVDGVFSANAVHIMPWEAVIAMIGGVGRVLQEDGLLVLYGPFNYQGKYSSDSNARFDEWLKQQSPHSAIRDFEAMNELAMEAGLKICDDLAMPANNRIIYWKKVSTEGLT